MLSDMFLQTLSRATNVYLKLDPTSEDRLKPLEGHSIALEIDGLPITLFLSVDNAELTFTLLSDQAPDTTLHGTPLAFARLATTDDQQKLRELLHDKVSIRGDVDIGQHFRDLIAKLDIDWEGLVAEVTGDVVAFQIGEGFRFMREGIQDISSNLARNVGEFMQEEADLTPPKTLLDEFCHDIDELRADVERSSARLSRIQAHLDNTTGDNA